MGFNEDYLFEDILHEFDQSNDYISTGKYILFRSPIAGTTWFFIFLRYQ